MGEWAKVQSFSFDLEAQRDLPVRIRHACRFSSDDKTLSWELSFPWWVLDCPWDYCGKTKVGATGWHRRDRGRMHLYAPGTGWIEDNRDAPGMHEGSFIFFDGGELLGLDRLTGATGFAPIYDPEQAVGRYISEMAGTGATHGNRGTLAALGRLYLIADRLLVIGTGEKRRDEDLEARLRNYFEAHFREKCDLESVAAALGMSRSSLTHRCRAEIGRGAMELLTEIRLEQSIPMLLRRRPLKQVAAAAGYDDMFHYSRVFKRRYGVAPTHYRGSLAGVRRCSSSP